MKKISVIALTFIFLLSAFAPFAMASDFSAENISVTVNGYDVEITVKADTNGRMTAHLYNETKDTTLGVDFNNTPTENSGVYTYNFIFELESNVPTQKLYIRVGNNVPATEKEINYASVNDKNAFLNGLASQNGANQVENYLKLNKQYTSADIASLEGLNSDVVRTFVCEIIDELALSTGYENLDTETEEYKINKANAVAEKERLFNEEFAQTMQYAFLADANEEDWETLADEAIEEGLFDSKYFVKLENSPVLDGVEAVYPYFSTEIAKMSTLSESEISKAFDRMTLMAVKNNMAYGTLKTAFLYFEDKGTIAVSDMTNIDALAANNTDVDLWKGVKAGTYTDCAALVANAVELAAKLCGNNTGTGGSLGSDVTTPISPGGFSGGSLGGGGGAGGSASKPTTPVTPTVPEGTFSDIDSVEWAKESIEALAKMSVLSGKGDGKFYPNDSVTREEFVKIIVAAFDLSDGEAECDFSDVSKDSWSYPYIAAANKLGIVSGDGESFNPASGISRQDMAVIIYRVFEHLELKVEGEKILFDDNGEISDYAKLAVEALTAAGIINGMGDGTFAPKGTVTRAQAAKVVYGLLDLVGGGK